MYEYRVLFRSVNGWSEVSEWSRYRSRAEARRVARNIRADWRAVTRIERRIVGHWEDTK